MAVLTKRIQLSPDKPVPMLDRAFKRLVDIGIRSAIARIERETYGDMPVLTGELRDTFKVERTAYGLRLTWEALNQDGQPYAKYVDSGAPGRDYPGYFFATPMQEKARRILIEELERALSGDWT